MHLIFVWRVCHEFLNIYCQNDDSLLLIPNGADIAITLIQWELFVVVQKISTQNTKK